MWWKKFIKTYTLWTFVLFTLVPSSSSLRSNDFSQNIKLVQIASRRAYKMFVYKRNKFGLGTYCNYDQNRKPWSIDIFTKVLQWCIFCFNHCLSFDIFFCSDSYQLHRSIVWSISGHWSVTQVELKHLIFPSTWFSWGCLWYPLLTKMPIIRVVKKII